MKKHSVSFEAGTEILNFISFSIIDLEERISLMKVGVLYSDAEVARSARI
jgi:hypothetical protein